ncbi:hypothetical protein AWB65_06940 [Caballeronia humi]|uniref:Uncharacterized protein n=1 Tax=Caballeronia humi TaxID=326474 RepID=A0A158JPA5_9BURK|nr:hypothetical protein AWB65_06940 [Caballeronia humi]
MRTDIFLKREFSSMVCMLVSMIFCAWTQCQSMR